MTFQDFLLAFPQNERPKLAPFEWLFQQEIETPYPEFLREDTALRYYALVGGPADVIPYIRRVAALAARHPILQVYAKMIWFANFKAEPAIRIVGCPELTDLLGDDAGVYRLMVIMGCCPLIEKKHRELNIPQKNLAEAMSWMRGSIEMHRASFNGIPGFKFGQASWLREHTEGHLFRIGRLEYLLGAPLTKPLLASAHDTHSQHLFL